MRKQAIEIIHGLMRDNQDIVFITADLGYYILDSIKTDYPDRFYNVGSSEQLMIGAAVGLSFSGKIPVCYSITPFLLYRPFEFIRNYLNKEKVPVKLIGSGRNTDYSHDGFTHWSEEHLKVMNLFTNIEKFVPNNIVELSGLQEKILSNNPVYISLSR